MKYAAFSKIAWLFDLEADSTDDALAKAKLLDPETDYVEIVSELDGPGHAA